MRDDGSKTMEDGALDLAGIGIGPSNLSLAALLKAASRHVPELAASPFAMRFFERRADFRWHPGLMLPGATLQVSMLKDLVTPVDPTNPYSFLAFLASHGRLYRALVADRPRVPRLEFEAYCRWVAGQMPEMQFGQDIARIDWTGSGFAVTDRAGRLAAKARNVVLATGPRPVVPPLAEPFLGEEVFHAATYMLRDVQPAGRRIAIIGGGQTGAELFQHLISGPPDQRPSHLVWISRRTGFPPLDDSAFANEWFLPAHVRRFRDLPAATKRRDLNEQHYASDGVSIDLLQDIYRRLYDLDCVEGAARFWHLLPSHALTGMTRRRGALRLELTERGGERLRHLDVDIAILATGYVQGLDPQLVAGIPGLLPTGSRGIAQDMHFDAEYAAGWDGPAAHAVFVQNAGRDSFGIADPNLSLLAWRSAVIVNRLLGRTAYRTDHETGVLDWDHAALEDRIDPPADPIPISA